jgi:hypothetical protein
VVLLHPLDFSRVHIRLYIIITFILHHSKFTKSKDDRKMSLKYFILALATLAAATPLDSPLKAATNDDPCEPCQPSGATGLNPPAIGSDLKNMYSNVLATVKDIHFKKARSVNSRQTSGFCCRASLDCVNLQTFNIPMCYDKFTTNFGFADGSYGSLTTGEYKSGNGQANLITGESGSENIYAADPSAKPNTSTLSIPPQYTGTGVGSAVPPGQLGSIIVYTTTVPGTTYAGPTTLPGTVRVKTEGGSVVSVTEAPSTITGATTLAPKTMVVTSTAPVAAASASSTGAAGRVEVGVLGAMAYALYAL